MCQFRAQRRAAISHQAPDMWSACAHSVVLVVLVAVAGAEEGPRMGDGASMHSFAAATVASAMATPSGCKVTAGVEAGAQAIGNFSDSINSTGWARLEVWAPVSGGPMVTPTAASLAAARAAGCVEGWLTHARVWQMVSNAKANLFPGGTLPTAAVLYLDSQLAWARLAAADTNRSGDDAVFWGQMAHLLAQFDGLVEGYNTVAPEGRNVSALDLYAVSSGGDLETLQKLLDVSVHGSSALTRRRYGHCSALVRALPGGSIAVAHTTWAAYWQMLRIYKVLHLGYAPGSPLSFSSYPGTLSSGDDWYAAGGTGLVVTETTNDIFNTSLLWRAADPLNAMVWHRAMIATQAASSGDAWTRLFSMHNSGTSPNQWIVVDSKAARQDGNDAAAGVLWIAEQIPGLVHRSDESDMLASSGWWGSWNIPYFEDVYNQSGYPAMRAKFGNDYDHDKCARARIFARNASQLGTVDEVQAFMRYNDFRNDPLSAGDPMKAVASRGDLASPPQAFGGYDTKVMLLRDAEAGGSLAVRAVSGPTHAQLAPFTWDNAAFANVSHLGQPTTFDFGWELFTPMPQPSGAHE